MPHKRNGNAKAAKRNTEAATNRRLRSRIRELEKERDQYHRSLLAMTRSDWTFTEEELRDIRENGVPFEQVVRELKKLKRNAHGKPKRPAVRA